MDKNLLVSLPGLCIISSKRCHNRVCQHGRELLSVCHLLYNPSSFWSWTVALFRPHAQPTEHITYRSCGLVFFLHFLFYFYYRGEDIFISVWNLHRSPKHWTDPDCFNPERWPLDGPNPNEINQNFR